MVDKDVCGTVTTLELDTVMRSLGQISTGLVAGIDEQGGWRRHPLLNVLTLHDQEDEAFLAGDGLLEFEVDVTAMCVDRPRRATTYD